MGACLTILTGCASGKLTPIQASQTPVVAARLHEGVVVAIRQVDIPNQAGARPGFAAVLTALRQTPPAGDIPAQEIVIRQRDGDPASIVETPPPVPGFAVGDNVAIAEGGSTALVHGN